LTRHPGTICVGAASWEYQKAINSNFGKLVDVYAPGAGLQLASQIKLKGRHRYQLIYEQGTGFASAIAAGVAAHVLSWEGFRGPKALEKTRNLMVSNSQTNVLCGWWGDPKNCTLFSVAGENIVNRLVNTGLQHPGKDQKVPFHGASLNPPRYCKRNEDPASVSDGARPLVVLPKDQGRPAAVLLDFPPMTWNDQPEYVYGQHKAKRKVVPGDRFKSGIHFLGPPKPVVAEGDGDLPVIDPDPELLLPPPIIPSKDPFGFLGPLSPTRLLEGTIEVIEEIGGMFGGLKKRSIDPINLLPPIQPGRMAKYFVDGKKNNNKIHKDVVFD
jgi:hypothetical protein